LPDLILLDVNMPEMNGFETCKKIKEDIKTKDIPVIFLTARIESEDIVKGFEVGGIDYVTKPFSTVELISRVKTHVELKKAREENQSNIKFKEDFLTIVAHDLKSPFSAILTGCELLLMNEDIEGENREILDMIFKNVKYQIDFIKELSEIIEIESNNIDFIVSNQNISELIDAAISIIKIVSDKKGIEIKKEADDNAQIKADGQKMLQILTNLLGNAVKFSKEGSTIEIRAFEDSFNQAEIHIIDAGVGISDEDLEKINMPYQKFTTEGTGGEKGSGLGLIICKKFIEMHGGRLFVESKKGKGSDFFFKLPLLSSVSN
jgi:signal transduction histidine kinase